MISREVCEDFSGDALKLYELILGFCSWKAALCLCSNALGLERDERPQEEREITKRSSISLASIQPGLIVAWSY